MTAAADPAARPTARFVVLYDTAVDATANLARYATFRGMILQLDEV